MLQGVCIDAGATTVLERGKQYFLFPGGPNHYYVSKFPKENSHFGVFRKSLFQIVQEDEWPPEPPADNVPVLDDSKVYKARLVWRTRGYRDTKLGTYYLRPSGTHAYFYHDKELKRPGGCFPLHWFEDFREAGEEETETNEDVLETNEAIVETEAPKCETEEEILENCGYEQITIFDLLE